LEHQENHGNTNTWNKRLGTGERDHSLFCFFVCLFVCLFACLFFCLLVFLVFVFVFFLLYHFFLLTCFVLIFNVPIMYYTVSWMMHRTIKWKVLESLVAGNAGVLFGRTNAKALILDFKSRGRLGRVKRATEGVGISLKGKGKLHKTLQIQHGSHD